LGGTNNCAALSHFNLQRLAEHISGRTGRAKRSGQCPGAGFCLRTFSLPDRELIVQTINLARRVGRDILMVQRS
jgi:hypothetical protein